MLDPLVGLLKEIRLAHNVSQKKLEACMHVPEGTYRHIESGRRKLPDYRDDLARWILMFENCVDASPDERRRILDEMSHKIIEQFSHLLDHLQRQNPTD
jgi:transcriptional regulator with XRE-family HTH domain